MKTKIISFAGSKRHTGHNTHVGIARTGKQSVEQGALSYKRREVTHEKGKKQPSNGNYGAAKKQEAHCGVRSYPITGIVQW